MRPVLSGSLLLLLFPAFNFAGTCSPAPSPGTVGATDTTAAPIVQKILVESAGCTKDIATLCPAVKNDMASLQPVVLDAASKNSACAVQGTAAGGGALAASDIAWYKKRTAFWFALYSDMSKKESDVAAGTYQISPSFQAQFLDVTPGIAAAAAPVVPPAPAPAPAAPAPAAAAPAAAAVPAPAPAAPVAAAPAPAIAAPAAAGAAPGKTTPPPAPTLTSISPAGAYTSVVGVALQDKDKAYTPKKIFFCVASSKPSAPAPDCTKAPSTAETLHNPDGTENGSDYVVPDGKGNFTAMIDKVVPAGNYIYAVENADSNAVPPTSTQVIPSDSAPGPSTFRTVAPLGAAVAGLDVSGASSTDPKPLFLATGIVDIPLSSQNDISQAKTWLTGLIRIAGMAQPGTLNGQLGSTSSVAGYLSNAINANPDSIVQSMEVSGGVAQKFPRAAWKLPYSGLDVGNNPQYKLSPPPTLATLSFVASFGAITPLSASQANPVVYQLTQQIYDQFQSSTKFPTGCPNITYPQAVNGSLRSREDSSSTTPPPCYVAFVPTDRTHFYRNYEGGFRLKFYADDFDHGLYRFPGVLDLTWGQNEYVTGGKLHAVVMHLGGVLPVSKVDGLYLFGSMDTQLNGKQGSDLQRQQLLLVPAPGVDYTSSSVTPISTSQPNRDRYRIGFGIDILHLIDSKINKATTTP